LINKSSILLPEVKASLARNVGSISEVRITRPAVKETKEAIEQLNYKTGPSISTLLTLKSIPEYTHACMSHVSLEKKHILGDNFL